MIFEICSSVPFSVASEPTFASKHELGVLLSKPNLMTFIKFSGFRSNVGQCFIDYLPKFRTSSKCNNLLVFLCCLVDASILSISLIVIFYILVVSNVLIFMCRQSFFEGLWLCRYRLISELVTQVLEEVGEEIHVIESRKRSVEFECARRPPFEPPLLSFVIERGFLPCLGLMRVLQ